MVKFRNLFGIVLILCICVGCTHKADTSVSVVDSDTSVSLLTYTTEAAMSTCSKTLCTQTLAEYGLADMVDGYMTAGDFNSLYELPFDTDCLSSLSNKQFPLIGLMGPNYSPVYTLDDYGYGYTGSDAYARVSVTATMLDGSEHVGHYELKITLDSAGQISNVLVFALSKWE